jgi:N-acyl-D-aspartate/D-glutamate deacylase
MLLHANTVWGLGDAGAHVKYVCDLSCPTFNLTHWARDRSRGDRIPIEHMVAKMTSRSAQLYGFKDRGMIRPGMRADLNVIDLQRLSIAMPELRGDLPAGGERFLQGASGYIATLVRGHVVRENGIDSGLRPGRLARAIA